MINGPSRRALFAGTLAGLALPAAVPAGAEATGRSSALPKRPNILLILADDLGWGEIGSNGQRLIHTPNLDRLAADGVQFKVAYSGAPLCAPSRCSLLTGLHNGHSTVRENPEGGEQHALNEGDLTFAEVLRFSGYRTACIGKWGFGPEEPDQVSHPNLRGFDEFFGYMTHKHAHQYFPKYLWHNREKVQLDGKTFAPDLFRQHAIKFIKEDSDQPFLLYFASNLPHSPSQVPGDAGPYQDKPWKLANRRHAEQVARLDRDVATLVDALHDAGVANDTLVLFTSDNGPHREKGVTPELFNSNGPFRGDKREVYEGGIRVPLIAWSPRLRPRVVRQAVAAWDLLPTLADLAEVPIPAHLDGLSYSGLLTGAGAPRHRHLIWNRPRKAQAIRRGRWKVVRWAPNISGAGPEGRVELYDLTEDVGETQDLAAKKPDLALELVEELDSAIGEDPRTPYGLRTEIDGDQLLVTLYNGSAEPWRDVRLGLDGPKKARARTVPRVDPDSSIQVGFALPSSGKITARAEFEASGEKQVFRHVHRKVVQSEAALLESTA